MKTSEVRRYRRALRQFQRLTSMQLKGPCCGVTLAQCLVLLEIDERGHLTMGQLSQRLRLDLSTLSRTVDNLVSKKLVARLRDDSDRRLVWIRLTRDGISTCEEIHKENDDTCRGIFEHIPASEQLAIIQNFETLIQAYLAYERPQVKRIK